MMTEVEIANIALDEVGKNEISTMSDTTPSGNLIRRQFDTIKARVLAEPQWWEFDKTVELNPAADAIYDGTKGTHRYRYDLPSRVVIKNVWDTDRYNIADYRIEGNYLFSDCKPIYLTYVPSGVTAFPEYIGSAMAYLLASRMAKKGEGGTSRTELFKIFKQELSTARKISRTQKAPDHYGLDGPYSTIAVRHSGADPENYPPGRYARS